MAETGEGEKQNLRIGGEGAWNHIAYNHSSWFMPKMIDEVKQKICHAWDASLAHP